MGVNYNLAIQEQKVMGLNTENGLYYFYDDRISEHPYSINALSRFNVYQEMIIGLLYRSFGFLFMTPFAFFKIALQVVVGSGGMALTYMATKESGSIFCGLASFVLYLLNFTEVTRIWYPNSLDLREFWALPILWIQIVTT